MADFSASPAEFQRLLDTLHLPRLLPDGDRITVRQLQRRLIGPLHLRHTWSPAGTAALPPPRLHGYMPLDDQPPLVDADITWFNPSFFWVSGALVSNVDDLDRFYDALFDGRLLPRRLLAEMLTPVDTGSPGAGYGLGLEIYTLPAGPR